jgi:hypothetical protein
MKSIENVIEVIGLKLLQFVPMGNSPALGFVQGTLNRLIMIPSWGHLSPLGDSKSACKGVYSVYRGPREYAVHENKQILTM